MAQQLPKHKPFSERVRLFSFCFFLSNPVTFSFFLFFLLYLFCVCEFRFYSVLLASFQLPRFAVVRLLLESLFRSAQLTRFFPALTGCGYVKSHSAKRPLRIFRAS